MEQLTQSEFRILVKAMKSVYSDPKFIADNDAFMVWYNMLNDLTYEQLAMAVKAYMQTENFPPTIAGLRSKVLALEPEEDNFNEAWSMVRKALSRSGYYWKEEFAKLPEKVQKAVGKAENLKMWSQMETSAVEGVIYSQFIKAYQAVQKRSEFVNTMSGDLGNNLQIESKPQEPVKQLTDSRQNVEITNFPPDIRNKLNALYKKLGHSEHVTEETNDASGCSNTSDEDQSSLFGIPFQ